MQIYSTQASPCFIRFYLYMSRLGWAPAGAGSMCQQATKFGSNRASIHFTFARPVVKTTQSILVQSGFRFYYFDM